MHCRHQTDNDSQRARHAGGRYAWKFEEIISSECWFRVPKRHGSFVADMPARESSPQHGPMVGQLALLSALRARSSDNSSLVRSPPIWRLHNGPDYAGACAWTPPSGARLPGEPVEDCARRELRDETGAKCMDGADPPARLLQMKRVLLTGISGTGKSTVINKLGELGYKVVDTDYGGFTVDVDSGAGPERLWRDDRIQEVLSVDDADVLLFVLTSQMAVRVFGLKCIEHDRAVGQPGRDLVQCRSRLPWAIRWSCERAATERNRSIRQSG
jgi:8-oxo-dGTP pyrophosphatase MutT (NUDIX family)